jgi:hypothetical protein
VSRARRSLFAARSCDHAIPIASNLFVAEILALFFRAAPLHIVLSAGSLMMKSVLPSCWMHSKLPPSHPRVLL